MTVSRGPRLLGLAVVASVGAVILLEGCLRFGGLVYRWTRPTGVPAQDGQTTLLCIGESTTAFGGDQAWPAQLERMLETSWGSGRVKVVNAGVPAADTTVLLEQLPEHLDQLRPSVVVAMMGANDGVPRAGGAFLPGGRATWRDDRVLGHLRTWRLLRLTLHERERRRTLGPVQAHVLRWQEPGPCGGGADGAVCGVVARAWDRVRAGDPEGGLALLEEAGSVDPAGLPVDEESALAALERAFLLANLDRLQEAEAAFHLASLPPVRPGTDGSLQARARVELGAFRFGQRRLPEADAAFLEALALVPDLPSALLGRAHVAWLAGRPAEALAVLQPVLAVRPTDPQALALAATALHHLGREEEADSLLGRLEPVYMPSPWFWDQPLADLVEMLEQRGQPARALALLERAIAARPDDEKALALGVAFWERRRDASHAAAWRERLAALRANGWRQVTRASWQRALEITRSRGVRLVAVQYPRRPVAALVDLLEGAPDVTFVDNEAAFEDLLRKTPYAQVFTDACYVDFGHLTPLGHRVIAENVWRAVVGEGAR